MKRKASSERTPLQKYQNYIPKILVQSFIITERREAPADFLRRKFSEPINGFDGKAFTVHFLRAAGLLGSISSSLKTQIPSGLSILILNILLYSYFILYINSNSTKVWTQIFRFSFLYCVVYRGKLQFSGLIFCCIRSTDWLGRFLVNIEYRIYQIRLYFNSVTFSCCPKQVYWVTGRVSNDKIDNPVFFFFELLSANKKKNCHV